MKTTFARLFGLIAGLVLLCVLFLGAGFRALLSNYLISAARESLSNNAQAVAELASAYDTTGQLEDNWDFRMSLSFASQVAETDAVIKSPDAQGQMHPVPVLHKQGEFVVAVGYGLVFAPRLSPGVVHFRPLYLFDEEALRKVRFKSLQACC